MRRRPLTVCAEPGCPALVRRGRCVRHARPPWRTSKRPRQARGYDVEHDRLRRQVAQEAQECALCGSRGRWELDHVIPQSRGGATVRNNVRRLCVRCHREKTAREGATARYG